MVLEFRCTNQVLKWERVPDEIYSGNIDIDEVAFKFCSLWDGFIKTAVFMRGTTVIQVLLDDNCICNIPPEVSGTDGTIYIGVFGIKGEQRRTSSVLSYYFGKGIATDGSPSEPTPDIYQQILNLYAETVRIAESIRADADGGKFDGDDGYTPVKGTDYFTEAEVADIVNQVTDNVSAQYGDVEHALDELHAYAQSLVGGDSV